MRGGACAHVLLYEMMISFFYSKLCTVTTCFTNRKHMSARPHAAPSTLTCRTRAASCSTRRVCRTARSSRPLRNIPRNESGGRAAPSFFFPSSATLVTTHFLTKSKANFVYFNSSILSGTWYEKF